MTTELAVAEAIVSGFVPALPEQSAARDRILAFIAAHDDALHRSCAEGHLTGSAMVVDARRSRALLMHHTKLRMWLEMGGHADGEGDLAAVALREAVEESGITGLRLEPGPADLDVHRVQPPGEPAHLHLDVRYVAVAPPGAVVQGNHESLELRWFTLAEIEATIHDESTLRLARLGLSR